MLFRQRFWAGIADGTITMAFRRWRRAQVIAGRRYRTPAGMIEVTAVDEISAGDITRADARAAGCATVAEVIDDLREGPDRTLYRIRFHAVAGPDPRDELAADDDLGTDELADIARRLDRLDRASRYGPWTAATLAAIAERPATRAAALAAYLGRETQPFKRDVRKLKALGLALSLDIGYRLSPRGEAWLRLGDHSSLRNQVPGPNRPSS